jgi:hypothetical protein
MRWGEGDLDEGVRCRWASSAAGSPGSLLSPWLGPSEGVAAAPPARRRGDAHREDVNSCAAPAALPCPSKGVAAAPPGPAARRCPSGGP